MYKVLANVLADDLEKVLKGTSFEAQATYVMETKIIDPMLIETQGLVLQHDLVAKTIK